MNEKDDVVLEYLSDVGSAESLSVIFWNLENEYGIDFSVHTLRRRLAKLVETGLVETPRGADSTDSTYYRISELGERYLAGDHQPEELPEDFRD